MMRRYQYNTSPLPRYIRSWVGNTLNNDPLQLDVLSKNGHFYTLEWRLGERMEFQVIGHAKSVDYTTYLVLTI